MDVFQLFTSKATVDVGATRVAAQTGSLVPNQWDSMQQLLGIGVALLMVYIEAQRRTRTANHDRAAASEEGWCQMLGSVAAKFSPRRFAPELVALSICTALSMCLRAYGNPGKPQDSEHEEAWQQIQNEWPLLATADTLLAFQALLRLIAIISVFLRACPTAPLKSSSAAFFFAAATARVWLATRTDNYLLDGPLGGKLPLVCEALLALMCAPAGLRGTSQNPLRAAVAVFIVGWCSGKNRLNLAAGNDILSDALFISAHLFEVMASCSYLWRSLFDEARQSALLYLLMVFQQSIGTYYFFEVFSEQDSLVGAGKPFIALHAGNLIQLGLYLTSTVVCLATTCVNGSRQNTSSTEGSLVL